MQFSELKTLIGVHLRLICHSYHGPWLAEPCHLGFSFSGMRGEHSKVVTGALVLKYFCLGITNDFCSCVAILRT